MSALCCHFGVRSISQVPSEFNGVKMELEITRNRLVKIWWAHLWRNLIAMVVGFIVGWIIGFIIGFILGGMGASVHTIQLIVGPIGAVLGLAVSIVPMRLILGKDFGEFRLVLVKNEGRTP